MDKIKPYLFWIICGVVLIIELVLITVMQPVNDDGKDVYKATRALNDAVDSFDKGYVNRTKQLPPSSFAIDNVDYFNNIKQSYLVSDSWMPGLQQVDKNLKTHKKNVEDKLKKSSEILHEPIRRTNLLADWYTAYIAKTTALLKQLKDNNQLQPPTNDPFAKAKAKDEEAMEEILRSNNAVRKICGFYTKGAQFPTTEEHPIITTRFHITNAIVKAALESEGSLLNNRLMAFGETNFVIPPEGVVRPKIEEIMWGTNAVKWDSENTIGVKGGRAITCTLKARGSASALLALTANIEKSQTPIFIVHGSQWSQPRNRRRDSVKAMDSDIIMTLKLAILDYQGGQQ